MPATVEIKLEGLRELVQALRRMPLEVRGKALERAAVAGGEVIAKAAAARATGSFTSRTGKLMRTLVNAKRMVRVLARSPEYVLVQIWPHGIPYAHLIEAGHRIVPKEPGRRGRRHRSTRSALGEVAARPFIGSAYEATKEQAAQRVLDELWQSVEDAWTGRK